MSKTSELIQKNLLESKEFKAFFAQEQLKSDLAEIVCQLRAATGLNQTEFADKVKKSRTTIYKIENGLMEPSFSTVEDIANAVGKRLQVQFVD